MMNTSDRVALMSRIRSPAKPRPQVESLQAEASSRGAQPDGRTLAILGYHKIGAPPASGWETWYYVPEATFADQLRCLKEKGWQVVDVKAFLRGLAAPAGLPKRASLLTFDDGYKSIRDVALPWLLRFEYPAVLFVPTDFIGGCNSFDLGLEPEEAICDWEDLRELERRGVSIQSHGASHRPFSDLELSEQEQELLRSKSALEGGLEKHVEVFAFPYGDDGLDPKVVSKALGRVGYRAACLYDGGLNRLPILDRYRLSRVAMGPDTDLEAELESRSGPVG